MKFAENEILRQFDLAYKHELNEFFLPTKENDIRYNFLPDLEDGYLCIASSRIHLYSESSQWAIVFEINGYHNRALNAQMHLIYFGNCINYPVDSTPERNYITNMYHIVLIPEDEFRRIENKEGSEMEQFELISSNAHSVKLRDTEVGIEHDTAKYEKLGIRVRDYNNPRKLIAFKDFVRYTSENRPLVMSATETEIKKHFSVDLPKLITINDFHFTSIYNTNELPSQQETYQLLAKILVLGDSSAWKPILKANNNWRNWDSGSL